MEVIRPSSSGSENDLLRPGGQGSYWVSFLHAPLHSSRSAGSHRCWSLAPQRPRKKEPVDWGKVSEMEGPQKLGCELEALAQPPCLDTTRLVLIGPPGQPLLSPVAHPDISPHPCFLCVCGCVCPLPWEIHAFMQTWGLKVVSGNLAWR